MWISQRGAYGGRVVMRRKGKCKVWRKGRFGREKREVNEGRSWRKGRKEER